MKMVPAQGWIGLTPVIFVLLWSTGFIGAKLGLPDSTASSFLLLRIAIVLGVLGILLLFTSSRWPGSLADIGHSLLVGILLHGFYLGGVFSAVEHGMSAGQIALITSLQPILTAVVAKPLLGEDVTAKQWTGIVLGFLGLILLLYDRAGLGSFGNDPLPWTAWVFSAAALLGITAASIYQKKFAQSQDLKTATFLQYGGAFLFIGAIAIIIQPAPVIWSLEFTLALGWLVIALSLGAVVLLLYLIREGEVSKVASLFYLVPPTTALMAYLLFDERLGPVELLGLLLVVFGVMLARNSAAET